MTALVDRAARYVAIPSVSGDERALADDLEGELRAVPGLEVTRLGDNVVARTTGDAAERVVLAGHLDTVPGEQGVDVDGGRVTGLGACDMKGSVAVMAALAVSGLAFGVEATFLFYACEEVARERSGLLEILAVRPELLGGDVAVVCEPTSVHAEAGCQGVARVRLVLKGERAHTARPWRGRNAIHRLAGPLEALAAYEPRPVELDGVTFTEQLQAVEVTGGVAGNVVPDLATLTVGLRVAPDRSADAAIAELRETFAPFLDGDGEFVVLDAVDPAPPHLTHPTIARLVERSGHPPRAKLGFTDVATFATLGIPAVNFGAGDPELAHHRGEFVDAAELDACFDTLASLLVDAPVVGALSTS